LYTHFQLAKKYLQYFFTASNAHGHGTHSPFVYDFIKNVLNNAAQPQAYKAIEQQRQMLLKNKRVIEIADFGAGSTTIKSNKRVVKKIAASSLKSKKYAQLLFKIAKYYQPKTIIELGTSFGITTSYLAQSNTDVQIFTCEGAKNIATIAADTFKNIGINNIQLIEGDFEQTLPPLLSKLTTIDFAFVDGNHRQKATLDYFYQFLKYGHHKTILIFDDIHWSKEMESAWDEIKQNPSINLSIDLFFIGIVFINPDVKQKQHFVIKY
jgi:predicted O-methyltransferase YrrM